VSGCGRRPASRRISVQGSSSFKGVESFDRANPSVFAMSSAVCGRSEAPDCIEIFFFRL
jgi:hypothetical protein